jgi:hypothetical protein
MVSFKLQIEILSIALALAMLGTVSSAQAADAAASKRSAGAPVLGPEAQKVADLLKSSLPPDSEARAMLDDIVQGSRLGPQDGWFRKAVSQTRFDWDAVQKKYDANKDGRIEAAEFRGHEGDFARLDRDHDASLTQGDFDWSSHSLAESPGMMLFMQTDRDGSGKITQEEFNALFKSLDSGSRGFVTLDDLRERLTVNPAGAIARRAQRSGQPSADTLVLALSRQELGSLQPGPSVGEQAPDFSLNTLDQKKITLSEQIGNQPVVLVFGNFTCGPFRSQAGNVDKLYHRYRDRAKFLMVYVREAHPKEGWWMPSNKMVGVDLPQPTTDSERVAVAQTCQNRLQLDTPMLVDTIDDKVGARYSGMPSRFYLIDSKGTVAFKSGRGPFGFKPAELEQALLLLLNDK